MYVPSNLIDEGFREKVWLSSPTMWLEISDTNQGKKRHYAVRVMAVVLTGVIAIIVNLVVYREFIVNLIKKRK